MFASLFQSRNRDACHFRWELTHGTQTVRDCFNLAIEMLVISGLTGIHARNVPLTFQSRNRDACHFRAEIGAVIERRVHVSISQSRCLSFQDGEAVQVGIGYACFNLAIEMLVISGHQLRNSAELTPMSFNLAIEMLVISGHRGGNSRKCLHGSFNLAIEMLVISGYSMLYHAIPSLQGFNLAIEMLVISGPCLRSP